MEAIISLEIWKYSKIIPYSWLKARIKDRSIKLGYSHGGFIEIYKFMNKK